MSQPSVLYREDPDGCEVVGVPISNAPGEYAWLYPADRQALVERFGNAAWFLHGDGSGPRYVRAKCPVKGRPETLARAIVEARALAEQSVYRTPLSVAHRMISYRDRDRLNLRWSNLQPSSGSARSRGLAQNGARPRHAATAWAKARRFGNA